jgi:hypothetical protein
MAPPTFGWYWHLVDGELRTFRHDVAAPNLPCDDAAGLDEYADTVVDAIGDRRHLLVVGQSLTAAMTGAAFSPCRMASARRLGFVQSFDGRAR